MKLFRITTAKAGLALICLMPLLRVTSDPARRQVLGLYSASFFGLFLLWAGICGLGWVLLSVHDARRRKQLFFKSKLVLISLVVAVFILEIGLRLNPRLVPMGVRERLAAGGAFLDFQGAKNAADLDGVRFPLAPNQLVMMTQPEGNLLGSIKTIKSAGQPAGTTYQYRKDHQGFCNPSNITGKVDCLFIGDSFTEMAYLPWE